MSNKRSFHPLLVILSGPSGSGKTTLCRLLADKLGFHYGISHTTRSPREGEVNGRDYHFVGQAEFEAMVKKGLFLESATVYGKSYGTLEAPVRSFLGAGEGVVLDLDTQGARAVKKKIPEAVLIFIEAPSISDLKSRLVGRGDPSDSEREQRLQAAADEERQKKFYDHVVINHDLDDAYRQLEKIVRLVHDA